jgi:hypothetical protein
MLFSSIYSKEVLMRQQKHNLLCILTALLVAGVCSGCNSGSDGSSVAVTTEMIMQPITDLVTSEVTQTETATVTTTVTTEPTTEEADIYQPVIDDYVEACKDLTTPYTYALADIDLDGFPELMVKVGESESDYVYEVWSKNEDNEAVQIGECTGGHTNLYYHSVTGAVYTASCQMDVETIEEYNIYSGELYGEVNEVLELQDSEYYQANGYYNPSFDDDVYQLVELPVTEFEYTELSETKKENENVHMTLEEYIKNTTDTGMTEDDLKASLQYMCSGGQTDYFCDDFDGDDKLEGFAIDGNNDGYGNAIKNVYYADSDGNVSLIGSTYEGMYGSGKVVTYSGSKKFFVLNTTSGNGTITYVYGVKDNASYKCVLSGELHDFDVDDTGAYTYTDGSDGQEQQKVRLYYVTSTEDFFE